MKILLIILPKLIELEKIENEKLIKPFEEEMHKLPELEKERK